MKRKLTELPVLDSLEKIETVLDVFNWFSHSDKLKLANQINSFCQTTQTKIVCPVDCKNFINTSYVSSYHPTDNDPMKYATEIDTICRQLKLPLPTPMNTIIKTKLNRTKIDDCYQDIHQSICTCIQPDTFLGLSKEDKKFVLLEELLVNMVNLVQFISTAHYRLLTTDPIPVNVSSMDIDSCIARDTLIHFIKTKESCDFELLQAIFHIIECRNQFDALTLAYIYYTIGHQMLTTNQTSFFDKLNACDGNETFSSTLDTLGQLHQDFFETESLLLKDIQTVYLNKEQPKIQSFREHIIHSGEHRTELTTIYNDRLNYVSELVPSLKLSLSSRDLFLVDTSRKFTDLFIGFIGSGTKCYFAKSNDNYYLLGKCRKSLAYLNLKELLAGKSSLKPTLLTNSLRPVTESQQPIEEEESITEGIEVAKDGTVTFTFSKKKSFMDEYAETHRLLVADNETGNYEGMKISLAYLFSMISIIERDYLYTEKKVKPAKLQDAKKARMFAYNDFKTYNKILVAHDKTFNFTEYYHEQGFDKMIFTITPDTLLGIKKLVNKILFSTI